MHFLNCQLTQGAQPTVSSAFPWQDGLVRKVAEHCGMGLGSKSAVCLHRLCFSSCLTASAITSLNGELQLGSQSISFLGCKLKQEGLLQMFIISTKTNLSYFRFKTKDPKQNCKVYYRLHLLNNKYSWFFKWPVTASKAFGGQTHLCVLQSYTKGALSFSASVFLRSEP